LRKQGGRRLPEGDPVAGRHAGLAKGDQGRDWRVDLAARDDGVLRAPGAGPGETQRGEGLHALMPGAKSRAGADSPLVASAEAFDATLKRFAALSDGLREGALDSQRNLERAAEALKQVAGCEEELQANAQALMAALGI